MEARTENRVSRIEEVCKRMAAIGHDAELLGTVRLISRSEPAGKTPRADGSSEGKKPGEYPQ